MRVLVKFKTYGRDFQLHKFFDVLPRLQIDIVRAEQHLPPLHQRQLLLVGRKHFDNNIASVDIAFNRLDYGSLVHIFLVGKVGALASAGLNKNLVSAVDQKAHRMGRHGHARLVGSRLFGYRYPQFLTLMPHLEHLLTRHQIA